jgi:hypothetical protein
MTDKTMVYVVEGTMRTAQQIDNFLKQIQKNEPVDYFGEKRWCKKYTYQIDPKTGREFYSFELTEVEE